MSLRDDLLRVENFFWAWQKARAGYSFDRTWYDEIELATFEATLKSNLDEIRNDFERGRYQMSPARPIAFPKRGDSASGHAPATRQMFWFSVRDQVAWLALLNVIGPLIDRQMPPWSYGDRLYRSVWRPSAAPGEAPGKRGSLKIGPYRHTSRHIYRPFKNAWPRYRRHIYLTVNVMASAEISEVLSADDVGLIEDEREIENQRVRVPYLDQDFWSDAGESVYWAGLDLQRFFPSTPIKLIERNLLDALRSSESECAGEVDDLIRSMLTFPLDVGGWTEDELSDQLKIAEHERSLYSHLPTGLLVSGFLANAALLKADIEVTRRLALDDRMARHPIAHFRYVDDHVVLSKDPDTLFEWLTTYQKILEGENDEWRLNLDKLEPPEVKAIVKVSDAAAEDREDLRQKFKANPLNPRFPRPLLSHTLTKISLVAATRFELLDDDSQGQFIQDLEMLLLADFGPSEVRPDTRASFAASVLSRSAPHFRQMTTDVWQAISELQIANDRLAQLATERQKYKDDSIPDSIAIEEVSLRSKLTDLKHRQGVAVAGLAGIRQRERRRIFRLLLDAISRYPDKIRLWQTAVHYCARTGHDGLQELLTLLSRDVTLHKLTQPFVLSVVTHGVARELLFSVRKLTSDNVAPEEREAAGRFIATVRAQDFDHVRRQQRWYSRRAWAHLLAATWASSIYVSNTMAADLFDAEEFVDPARQSLGVFRSRYHRQFDAIVRHANQPPFQHVVLADVGVWLENTLGGNGTEPTSVWQQLRSRTEFDGPSGSAFYARYPNHVSVDDLVSMVVGTLQPFSSNPGWYYDSLIARLKSERKKIDRLSRLANKRRNHVAAAVRGALNATHTPRKTMRLDQWTEWLVAYPRGIAGFVERASDPRLSEWTALAGMRKIVARVASMPAQNRPPLHHSTVLIPIEWTSEHSSAPGGVSWSEWKAIIASTDIQLARDSIDDERYMGPNWRLDNDGSPDWPWIRAVGMLLLGVLQRSFKWPAAWNPDYSQNARSNLSRAMVSMLPCSSLTTAILEALLTGRSRENVVRMLDFGREQIDEDTTFDPPIINSLLKLDRWLKRSMKVLEEHQLSGRGNRPRQLVPLRLKQLTHPEWTRHEVPDDFAE